MIQQASSGQSFDALSFVLSLFGGFVGGFISAIPIPGFSFASYLFTGLIGGTGSLIGGLISGSVTDLRSAALAFGIGFASGIITNV